MRRVNLYLTAMSLRATWLHPDSKRALNSIDTIVAKAITEDGLKVILRRQD
jgi:hypothetical protein